MSYLTDERHKRLGASLPSEGWDNPADGYTMPFGRHEGKKLDRIPAEYLRWLLAKSKGGRATNAILEHLATRA